MECESEGESEEPGAEPSLEASEASHLPVPEAASEHSKEPTIHDRQVWPGEETAEGSFESTCVDEEERQLDATGTTQDAGVTEEHNHGDPTGANKGAITTEEQKHQDVPETNEDASTTQKQNHGDATMTNENAKTTQEQNHGDATRANKNAITTQEQNHGDASGTEKPCHINSSASMEEGLTSATSASPGGETSCVNSDFTSSHTTSPEPKCAKGAELPSSPSFSPIDLDLSTPTQPSQASPSGPSKEIIEPQPVLKTPNPPNVRVTSPGHLIDSGALPEQGIQDPGAGTSAEQSV